jgi:hypothetical protein
MLRFILLITTLLSLAARPAASQPAPLGAASLLTNGDFQQGDFAGWTLNAGYTDVMNQPFDGYAAALGTTYAILGPIGADGTLSQGFTDTPGGQLAISFRLASDGELPNDFSVAFDGTVLLSLTDIPLQGWSAYSFDVTATGTDTLRFAFRDDPGYLALDGISVTEIPEPGSALLLVAGLAGAALARRAVRSLARRAVRSKVCLAAPRRNAR